MRRGDRIRMTVPPRHDAPCYFCQGMFCYFAFHEEPVPEPMTFHVKWCTDMGEPPWGEPLVDEVVRTEDLLGAARRAAAPPHQAPSFESLPVR